MSKFRNLVESILLSERVLQCDIPPFFGTMFNDLTFHNKVNILKNPSKTELEMFLNNSKAGQLRSITINGDIYYIDAFIAMHTNLLEILKYNGYVDKDTENFSPNYISTNDEYNPYASEEAGNDETKDIGGLYQIYRTIDSTDTLNDYIDICPDTIQYLSKIYSKNDFISPNKDGINQFITKLQQIR